ncbi:alcohol dehydrogenase [Moniliophthora roreri MCA 2997]|uniref:Alcohol dehydrogenase n=2 Tax=Moniliophthora roreri TaxID=221103 RepID=V2WWM9_MONRO|nr:alcohol dehydrogenase [Moniliophthora roreri MCA 2997]KAI3610991.1 alcohol dehydrogenase [Moniliophthora roreri]
MISRKTQTQARSQDTSADQQTGSSGLFGYTAAQLVERVCYLSFQPNLSSLHRMTHRAVRWYPPSFDIRVEHVPKPKIEKSDDVIVKVTLAALCGSDLHIYRGHGGVDRVHTCGHEFMGEIVQLGDQANAKQEGNFPELKVGDKVVAPFTANCGECHVCRVGYTCRCPSGFLFGSGALDGGQAQFIRVPYGAATLLPLSNLFPAGSAPNDPSLLLLADILPTGVFGALQLLNHPKVVTIREGKPWPDHFPFPVSNTSTVSTMNEEDKILNLAVIGLGPVGICACVALLDALWRGSLKYRIVAIDLLEGRREKLKVVYNRVMQSEPDKKQRGEFIVLPPEEAKAKVQEWTNDVGCTGVLEAVGHIDALELAFDLVRAFGTITSVGVHGAAQIPFTGRQLYNKNISLDFGRCPARAMVPLAAELLLKRQDVFGEVGTASSLIDRVTSLDEAPEMYRKFERGDVGKVLFDPWK